MSARLRFRLHRCMSCWHRGVYVVTLTPQDADGNPVGPDVQHRACDKHAQEALDALVPVAEELAVNLENGRTIRWTNDDRSTEA